MKRKTEIFIAITVVTAVTCYLFKKIINRQKSDYTSIKQEADKYFIQEDYKSAILLYTKCKYMKSDAEILTKISLCNYFLKNYQEVINNSLFKTNNKDLIKIRSECYKQMGNKKKFLKDLALYETFANNKEVQDEIMQTVKEICEEEVSEFIEQEGLKINKEDVLRGLVSIKNINEIYDAFGGKSKKFKFSNDEKEVLNLLNAIILHLKGKKEQAILLLEKSTYKYSILYRAYFLTLKNEYISSSLPLDDEITTLYLYSKIFKDKSDTYLKSAIDKSVDLPIEQKDFLYVDLLVFYISKKDVEKVNETINNLKATLTPTLLELIGEYYLKSGNHSKMLDLLSSHPDTPGKLLLTALYAISIDKKKDAIEILYRSISEYSSYFKSYLYLGNILINDDLNECRKLFNTSLQYCCNSDEVFIVKQSLILIEVHEYIKENKI